MTETEWGLLRHVLGDTLLSDLLHADPHQLRQYQEHPEHASAETASRARWLLLVISDLQGAYAADGIQSWFRRERPQLSGLSPATILMGSWQPHDEGPLRVKQLAESLRGPSVK